MFGTYKEWIVFEFSDERRLVRKLCVDIGSKDDFSKIRNLREKLNFPTWTDDNADIVRVKTASSDVLRLPPPEDIANMSLLNGHLTCGNYVKKMHWLLQMEELTRLELISQYVIMLFQIFSL